LNIEKVYYAGIISCDCNGQVGSMAMRHSQFDSSYLIEACCLFKIHRSLQFVMN